MAGNIIQSLITGFASSAFVVLIFVQRDKRQWRIARSHLTKELQKTINAVVTTLRIGMKIKYPSPYVNQKQFVDYIKKNMLRNFDKYNRPISLLSEKEYETFSTSLSYILNELKRLELLFLTLKSSDPYYVEAIFKLEECIGRSLIDHQIVPELHDDKHANDEKLKNFRESFVKHYQELLETCVALLESLYIKTESSPDHQAKQ